MTESIVWTSGGGAGKSSGSWNADPQGSLITWYFDGNAAERAPILIPIGKNKSPSAEQKVPKNVWI